MIRDGHKVAKIHSRIISNAEKLEAMSMSNDQGPEM